jgi:hypothetical protein
VLVDLYLSMIDSGENTCHKKRPLGQCADLGAGGVFSPAVDGGFYVLLDPLSVGHHTLHFHAKNAGRARKFEVDVTYNITVVPVLLQ